jgi:hypothetical protein
MTRYIWTAESTPVPSVSMTENAFESILLKCHWSRALSAAAFAVVISFASISAVCGKLTGRDAKTVNN